eukprot:gene21475-33037_t
MTEATPQSALSAQYGVPRPQELTPEVLAAIQEAGNNKCCEHNNWDNVRVIKKMMVLRCRSCQLQWRAKVEMVWGLLACEQFRATTLCEAAECPYLHIHPRKQSLEDRIKKHGDMVLAITKSGRITKAVLERIEKERKALAVEREQQGQPLDFDEVARQINELEQRLREQEANDAPKATPAPEPAHEQAGERCCPPEVAGAAEKQVRFEIGSAALEQLHAASEQIWWDGLRQRDAPPQQLLQQQPSPSARGIKLQRTNRPVMVAHAPPATDSCCSTPPPELLDDFEDF